MTREEAIQWLKHINITDFGWDDYAMQDSQKEIRERCEQSIREAIDMAISALSEPNMIPIMLEKRYPHSRDEDITDAFMRGYQSTQAELVRCKDCRYRNGKVNRKGFEVCDATGMDITDNDYCSFGERREMIIDIGTGVDESVVKWKYNDKDKWRDADIDELIHLYESVVHCKDCRFAMVRTEKEMNKPIKPQPILCEWFCIWVENDDYCSHGERR